MIDIIQNPFVWLAFLFVCFGFSIFILGLAKEDKEITSSLGSFVIILVLVLASIFIKWWLFAPLLVLAYLTQSLIAYPIAFLLWKGKYRNSKFLSLGSFKNMISNSGKPIVMTQQFQDKVNIYCDMLFDEGKCNKQELESYTKEILSFYDRFFAEEIFSSWEKVLFYFDLRKRANLSATFLKMAQSFGIVKGIKDKYMELHALEE
ncbi:MAG: hypothetical protein US26_C0011G0006 [Candidatus Nomurabacteria bacterium GW2011_GWE1_36_71]|nr:MAG: hypothetical protein US26_C0011G0006 [Candidatus Nomurabacteria bacterium GW2011_GWE1_36_71]